MDHEESCSCHRCPNSGLVQTLTELDFERGIWNAVIYNDIDRVRDLIVKGHTNDRDNSGYTALHYAARSGNKEICLMLIENGADVNAKTNGGATPLHRASMMGHLEIVKILIGFKANVMEQDEDGQTALHRSAAKSDFFVSLYLSNTCECLKKISDKKGRIPYDLIPKGNERLENMLKSND